MGATDRALTTADRIEDYQDASLAEFFRQEPLEANEHGGGYWGRDRQGICGRAHLRLSVTVYDGEELAEVGTRDYDYGRIAKASVS